MAMSEINYGENSIVDLASDTVTEETLLKGVTAHDATGAPITGTMYTVPNSALLGGKPPEAYTAVNLVRNSDFSNPLNTNGYVSGTLGNADMCIDGWRLRNGTSLSLENGFAKLSGPYDIWQNISQTLKAGVTYTIAARLRSAGGSRIVWLYAEDASGNRYATPTNENNGAWVTLVDSFTLTSNVSNMGIYLTNSGDTSVATDIAWVALYEGSYTAETLPPYVPSHPRIESLKIGNPVQPVNLLDNSDFRNPINKRGATANTKHGEDLIDRWYSESANNIANTVLVSGNGITLAPTVDNYCGIAQKLERYSELVGKTCTAALCVNDTWHVGTLTIGSTPASGVIFDNGLRLYSTGSIHFLIRSIAGNSAVTIQQVALYEGSYTAETLPPYVPSHKRVESLKIGNPVHPVNLLDNSDFTNPVNQRGQTTYTGSGTYSIDRWYVGGSNQRIDVASGSIKATTTKGTTYATIAQTVANITRYAGKTLTFAAYVRSNVVPRLNILNGDNSFANTRGTSGDYQLITCSFVVPDGIVNRALSVRIQSISTQVDDYVEAKWAALYEGTYTAETLPPYVPKPYAVELAECKRYFQVAKATYGLIPYHSTTESRSYNVLFEQEMRVKPTILTVAESCVEYNPGVWSNTGATFTIVASSTLNAIVTATGTITANTATNRPFAFIAYTASADL